MLLKDMALHIFIGTWMGQLPLVHSAKQVQSMNYYYLSAWPMLKVVVQLLCAMARYHWPQLMGIAVLCTLLAQKEEFIQVSKGLATGKQPVNITCPRGG